MQAANTSFEIRVIVLAMFLAILPATHAGAQEASETAILDEVVVTARKREENLQDIPVSVTAFSLAEIQSAGFRNSSDVAALTPGFNMAPLFGGDAATPVIRGLSTTIGEPNVGFFIDGVYFGSRQTMTALLGNFVERIEIAKGPQSALYGRNTFGGAINYVSRQPSSEFEGDLEFSFGNDGAQSIRATVGGPFGDSAWSYRLAASYDEFDGFYTNELTGGNLDSRKSTGALASLAWQGDKVDLAFNIFFDSIDNGDDPLRYIENNDVFYSAFGLPPDFQLYTGEVPSLTSGYAVTPGSLDRDQLVGSVAINWAFGGATLTSITGYTDFDHDRQTDDDYSAPDLHYTSSLTSVTELSQELRLTSEGNNSVEWMVGLYGYSREESSTISSAYQGFLLPIFGGLGNVTSQDTDDLAIFGSVGFDISDSLTLTLAGRYGREKKSVVAEDTDLVTGTTATFLDNGSWNAFLPQLTLDWNINADHMAYFRYARAEKSGGFNVVTATGSILPEERIYQPESSDNFEVGLKSTLVGGTVAMNIAAYYTNWQDQIVRALGQTNAVLNTNAGETTSKGVEVELFAQSGDYLTTRFGLAYNDSRYDEYIFGALAALGADPDLSGNTLQYSPKWMANLSLNYERPISGDWSWFGRVDWDYLDEQTIVQTASAYVAASDRVNIHTGLDNGKWQLKVWAYNLFDDDSTVTGAFLTNPAILPDLFVFGTRTGYQVFQGLITGPQLRTYGLTVKYSF